MVETYQVSGSPSNSLISHSSWLFRPPLRPHRLEAQEARMGNSSPNPHPHSTPLTHSRQVQLCAHPHQPLTPGQRQLLCGVRRDLIRGTSGKCKLIAIRIGQLTPLAASRLRLIHTNPRSAACAISTAQDYHSQSFLADGVDPPRPASLHNYRLRMSPLCQRPRQGPPVPPAVGYYVEASSQVS